MARHAPLNLSSMQNASLLTPGGGVIDFTHILLPVEIIEKILLEIWAGPLSIDDRITLFTSLCLTSRTMLSIFIRIALRDVHIMTPMFSQHYLRMLRTRTSDEPDDDYLLSEASATANRICRSITFHVDAKSSRGLAQPAVRLYSDGNREAEAVSTTLYMLDLMHTCVPNLRTVAVHYHDWGFDDLLDQCRILPMPRQVTDLEVAYTFSHNLARVAHEVRRKWGTEPQHCTRWTMAQTRKLTVRGAPARFVSAMLETVPNVETLEVDETAKLTQLKDPLPKTLRSLVLRKEVPPRCMEEGADSWALGKAIKRDRLSTSLRELDVIVIGAGSNVRSRGKLKRACESNHTRMRFVD